MRTNRTGVWLIGALGDIATTLIAGKLIIQRGLASTNGLITTKEPISNLNLPSLDQLVIGGIDIRHHSLLDSLESIYTNSRTISREQINAIKDDVLSIDKNIVKDELITWTSKDESSEKLTLEQIVERISGYIREFKDHNALENVIVVDISSAEPALGGTNIDASLDEFIDQVKSDSKEKISPSSLYAYTAFSEGCSHINFTPNIGALIKGLQHLAHQQNVLFCGNDGKTGETLLKTILAPMFLCRNLEVLSWEGVNLLGNKDGLTLSKEENRALKLQNKGNVLSSILGYTPHSGVSINYVPSLGDWKTAWDLIHFKGFLNVNMTMQFTWQGCDSILAAPLVLDMIRLVDFAWQNGEIGSMPHLASFFKNPIGVKEMEFTKQMDLLINYALQHLSDNEQP
jgi:myo-inositol-1-phosphate synthase